MGPTVNGNGSTMNSVVWVPRGARTHGRSRNLGALVVVLNALPADTVNVNQSGKLVIGKSAKL